jgi:ATP-dependent RNA helicase DeaD
MIDDMAQTATPEGEASAASDDPRAEFAAMGLGAEALRAIEELGYGEPTPIQRQTIPLLLEGRDVIAQAPTGTGKTAAYGLPIVEHLEVSALYPQALVLVPTRELAIQVAEALHALGKHRELVTLPIYGGAPYERQFRALRMGVQVVVGTPGRLLDHLRRETLDLSRVKTVVLDEADEMLDMGFIEDIEAILQALPAERQSALFSATIPARVARLAEAYLREPVRVSVAAKEAVAPKVRQVYYEVTWQEKAEALARILDYEQPESAIVFVRTRRDADEVSERLNGLGYLAQPIHGEINQAQRERALERFRAGRTQLLVATDVAARGLDIPDVSHVINYDLPMDADSYVHRIGRTGRAGRTGEALTLVTPRERRTLQMIERLIHRRLQRLRLPTESDVAARRRAAFRDELLGILDAGQLDPFLDMVEDLAESRDPMELAAAAFKLAALSREASATRGGRRDGAPIVPAGRPEAAPAAGRPAARARRAADERAEPSAPQTELAAARAEPVAAAPEVAAQETAAQASPASAHTPEVPTKREMVSAERARRGPAREDEEPRPSERPAQGERARPVTTEPETAARGSRGRRDERPERDGRDWHGRPERDGHGADGGVTRLFVRVGRRDKVRPADFVGAIANEAHLAGDEVGDIDIYDSFSFVEVPAYAADRVLRALNRTTIRGRPVDATVARPEDNDGRRDAQLRPARLPRLPLPARRGGPIGRRGAGRFGESRPPFRREPPPRKGRERRP